MHRYAFIDVQNTETTTRKVLNFNVDNEKLLLYLKEKWGCEQVFFYPGIEHGDEERHLIFKRIESTGAIVRAKYYSVYKNIDKVKTTKCPRCRAEVTQRIDMGSTWKCNCDVDMTMDILDHARKGEELLIFTGDGDFAPLVERAVAGEAKVYLASSMRKMKTGSGFSTSRFAAKLKILFAAYPKEVIYLDIYDWKMRIKKD